MSQFCVTCNDLTTTAFDPSSATSYCEGCGNVLEENAIVNEITFGETSGGAAIVQGSYVAAGSAGPRQMGPRGQQGTESREVTINNGKRRIWNLANGLSLPERVSDSAQRTFTLAVSSQFTRGRRAEYVAASCLYVACRFEKTTHMLIDFSDFLRINVFVLGATYLRLVKELGLQLPLIEPSVYISRFAHLLEFGDETQRVAQDAIRLVKRFNRDWMQTGRRPAGMCGAALVLAARMNNFRRSVSEVVQVVKIADVTIKKRLEEFKHTASGALSVQEFREVWLEQGADPPAYKDASKRRARQMIDQARAGSAATEGALVKADNGFSELIGDSGSQITNIANPAQKRGPGRPSAAAAAANSNELSQEDAAFVDSVIDEEIQASLHTTESEAVAAEVDEMEQERRRQAEENALRDEELDEAELDAFILSPEEVKEKERLWIEMNKDYLESVAEKQRLLEGEDRVRKPRVSKKRKQPADSTTATHANAAESAKNLLQKRQKVSKKLNYDVLGGLFDTGSGDGEKPPGEREDTADLDYYGNASRNRKMQQHRSESPTIHDAAGAAPQEPDEVEEAHPDDGEGEHGDEEGEGDVVDVDYDPNAAAHEPQQQQQAEEAEEEEEEEEEEEPNYDEEGFTHDADAFDVDDF